VLGQRLVHRPEDEVAALRAEVERLQAKNGSLRKERESFRMQCNHLKRKLGQTKVALDKAQAELASQSSFVLSKRRRANAKWSRLSVEGGYKLALSRNIGHTSCYALSQILEVGVSRQCVVSWELLMAKNLMVQSRAWHS
jgi:regulator of replication initiation timing